MNTDDAEHFFYCLLMVFAGVFVLFFWLYVLTGCSSKNPRVSLDDYDRAGSYGPMRMHVDRSLTHQQSQWVSGSAVQIGNAYQNGIVWHHFGPSTYPMNINGQVVDLVPVPTIITRPGRYVSYNDMVHVIVVDGPVTGYTPTGPGTGCKAGLVWTDGGQQAIVVSLGAKGELAGLYTALTFRYERENVPEGELEERRWWAEIYAVDDGISHALRTSR